ncbi:hypothetical protein VaNZ11_004626 [Volvox africanus]|uniref:Uncharacterized protein n=1 Tax=Volvox africanus TaxID=51714 RepID=A0ABQ5RXZ2_9CHLO|nr:hypothetical protein VaNZ11_004626 [Volvox africanus]
MIGGLKQARFEISSIRQPQLKTKPSQQQKVVNQFDADKPSGGDDDDLLPDVPNDSGQPESSPVTAKGEPRNPKDAAVSSRSAGPPKGHEPTVQAAAKGSHRERGRPRTGTPTGQADRPAPKKQPQIQHTQAAGCRVEVERTNPQPLTGDDIWQLNLKLGRMVEQLADPEDSKAGRRKQNGPTLTENLTKRWGGNYSQLLDKSFPTEEAEEPPPPKYEPPLFLENVSMEDVQGNEDSEPQPSGNPDNASVVEAVPTSSPVLKASAAVMTAPNLKGAAATPGTKAGAGRRGAAMGRKKASTTAHGLAAPAGAAAKNKVLVDVSAELDQDCADMDVCQDAPGDTETSDGQGDVQTSGHDRQKDNDLVPTTRRGGRRAKAGATEAAAKAVQPRPQGQARRAARGAGAAAKAATAADQDPGDAMDTAPMTTVATALAPSGSTNPTRIRRSIPPVTAFGSTVSKPPLPPPLDPMEDPGANGGDAGAVAAKRSRDTLTTCEDKPRISKAIRMEQQQQAKDTEALRSRNAELDIRCRQQADLIKELKEERASSEKRIASLEMERKRDASDLAATQREIEKLRAELKDRDDKIKARDLEISKIRQSMVEVKQLKDQMDAVMKGWPK